MTISPMLKLRRTLPADFTASCIARTTIETA